MLCLSKSISFTKISWITSYKFAESYLMDTFFFYANFSTACINENEDTSLLSLVRMQFLWSLQQNESFHSVFSRPCEFWIWIERRKKEKVGDLSSIYAIDPLRSTNLCRQKLRNLRTKKSALSLSLIRWAESSVNDSWKIERLQPITPAFCDWFGWCQIWKLDFADVFSVFKINQANSFSFSSECHSFRFEIEK